jgi:hypothetical protein
LIHLFDSFEGIPSPEKNDFEEWMPQYWKITLEACDGRLVPTGALVASQADAEYALFSIADYPKELVTFQKGWFQNTIPLNAPSIGQIAMLRLDGDLYESTLVSLRHLYPLVTPGGFIIIDDYCLKGCREACEIYFEEIGVQPFIHYADKCTRYIVKE